MPSKGRRFGWRKVARISRSWTSEWANLSPNDAGHHVMLPCWNSLEKYISLAKVPNLWRLQTLRHQDQEFLVKKVAARALAKAPRQALSWQALASFFVAEVLKQSFNYPANTNQRLSQDFAHSKKESKKPPRISNNFNCASAKDPLCVPSSTNLRKLLEVSKVGAHKYHKWDDRGAERVEVDTPNVPWAPQEALDVASPLEKLFAAAPSSPQVAWHPDLKLWKTVSMSCTQLGVHSGTRKHVKRMLIQYYRE